MSEHCKHRVMDRCKKYGRPCFFSKDCFEPEEPKQTTNGDRFRSMTNEELAVTLPCPNDMGMAEIACDCRGDKSCCACLLGWLNQPEEGSALWKSLRKQSKL